MAIQSRKNQYRGVNAHLHSLMLSDSYPMVTWQSFHGDYITFLMSFLNQTLPSPYFAVSELSLQVFVTDGPPQHRRPDVTIFERSPGPHGGAEAKAAAEATITFPLDQTLIIPDETPAVVIYKRLDDHMEPVTRLELLSPSNKQGSDVLSAYHYRRLEALQSGLPLVEIDLLHEGISPVSTLKRYPEQEGAFPYNITLSDPRTDKAYVFAFRVDDPIPTITIPLHHPDSVTVDFAVPYQRAFHEGPWWRFIDYEVEPPQMDAYRPDDQARIQARLATVAQAVQRGDDLEKGPF